MNCEHKAPGKRLLKRVVLEISPKPFRRTDSEAIADACERWGRASRFPLTLIPSMPVCVSAAPLVR